MRYRQIYKDISIVTIGKINRDICNPLNLYKHKVISQEEMESINDKELRIGADVVSFRTGSFELYCDPSRMQVRTADCSRSDQISDITLNILRLSETVPSAIGINATFRFGLDEPSFLRFCDRCAPMTAFSPMADNALMFDLSFFDWNHPENNGQPQANFNIKRLPDEIGNQKVIQISTNNHLNITDGMNAVMSYLAETQKLHSQFFDNCQQFISGIK